MPTHRVVSIDELSQYLHLPEKAVAKELGICLTSLKKLCRQHGITRWPYRKLKSLDKKLAKAESGAGGDEDPEAQKARGNFRRRRGFRRRRLEREAAQRAAAAAILLFNT